MNVVHLRRHYITGADVVWGLPSSLIWHPASLAALQVRHCWAASAFDSVRQATPLALRAPEAQLRPLWHDQAELVHERKAQRLPRAARLAERRRDHRL